MLRVGPNFGLQAVSDSSPIRRTSTHHISDIVESLTDAAPVDSMSKGSELCAESSTKKAWLMTRIASTKAMELYGQAKR